MKNANWPREWLIGKIVRQRQQVGKPSATKIAERLHKTLWKLADTRANPMAKAVICELSRQGLVQVAGQVSRDSESIAYRWGQRTGTVGGVAVTVRDDNGKPTSARIYPKWVQLTFADVLEVRDRMAKQIVGMSIHLKTIDAAIALFSQHGMASDTTIAQVCAIAGIDPMSLDLDQILGNQAI